MTGEIYSIDQNGLEPDGTIWSLHAAISKHFNGKLNPFDKYQGPEIFIPKDESRKINNNHSLWIIGDLHNNESYVYDKVTEKRTSFFNNTLPDDFVINLIETQIINPIEIDETQIKYYVDIPQVDKDEYLNLAVFDTESEAIEWAKENLGADDKGNINVISKA